MRLTSVFIFFLISQLYSIGQNFIPDPGFEIKSNDCVGNPPLVYWFSPNIATPDLYSVDPCGNQLSEENMDMWGAPLPFEGQSYAGLYCCMNPESVNQTRDYLSTQLLDPLQESQIYIVRFKLSRRIVNDLAIDKIGVFFSVEIPMSEGYDVMDVEPQLETSGEVLTPDLEWVTIEFEYVAQGGEQYLTIGNFRYPEEMNVVYMGLSWKNFFNAYYLFDDVSLELKETSSSNVSRQRSSWIINSDCQVYSNSEGVYSIFAISGVLLRSGIFSIGMQTLPISELPSGIYLIQLKNNTESRIFKHFKN